jgi:hypothetical protein
MREDRVMERRRATKRRRPTDEELALEYLAGKFGKRGITHKFHKPGSKGEAVSRAALIRLLRRHYEPLSPMIRFSLAGLLDPDSQYQERTFTIVSRRPGARPRHAFMIEIARFVAVKTAAGDKIESVKEAAKQRYGVSMSTVDRAWSDHGDFAREVWINPIEFEPHGSN